MIITDSPGQPKAGGFPGATLLPPDPGGPGKVLTANGDGQLRWADPPSPAPKVELATCAHCAGVREYSQAGCPNCGAHTFKDR
jgi:hypothetical protein